MREKLYSKGFLVFVRPAQGRQSRIGLTVSRRVSLKATSRNIIKRRFREIFRGILRHISPPVDVVIIAKSSAVEMTYAELERQFVSMLQKAGNLPHRLQLVDKT